MNNLIEKRIIAYFIDGIIINLLSVPVYIYIVSERLIPLYGFFFQILFFILYFYILETFYNKTIGKSIMKLIIIREKGGNILVRTLCRLIPFDTVSFLFNSQKDLWHDTISKTMVKEHNTSLLIKRNVRD
ncbi:RDD family protein [Elizabethkingia meningoseptica]|uniref:RDD family protein n=1 Tax=Elizabethkingia meningoseptica TaxID=238 RepID=UPI0023B07D29|nr:RDD family protein [Elizabethkingia meningoseptica]MDE5437941.1 RDD family protein [Elizabethkingia meningoseptica]MDE5449412.1 RDD family protein [Elizabethkingia meningoseptica]MDE5508484.1 RDD family protein [Elizabethkingia meningoseptica]MDE5516156.1 RDD family protein [Elizabethkingia meningoseptica]MDE5526868.1 RDD family protein [Elizabethkingia meningoseptica]